MLMSLCLWHRYHMSSLQQKAVQVRCPMSHAKAVHIVCHHLERNTPIQAAMLIIAHFVYEYLHECRWPFLAHVSRSRTDPCLYRKPCFCNQQS